MTIPRVFHQVWLGGEVPPTLLALHRRMMRLNPGWEVRVWREPEIERLGLVNLKWYRHFGGLPYKSDVARYEIVARHGGVYVDWDLVWLRTLESVVSLDFDFVASEKCGVVNNGVFGCARGSPFAWALVAGLDRACRAHAEIDKQRGQCGVYYFSRTWRRFRATVPRLPHQLFHPWTGPEYARAPIHTHESAVALHFFNSNGLLGRVEAAARAGLLTLG